MKRWLLTAGALLVVVVVLIGVMTYARHRADLSRQLVLAVNHQDAAQVETLLARGADPNVRDWKTYYEGGGEPFIPPWYERPLAALMRRPPREGDHYVGPTVLMVSAYHGDIGIVQALLRHGADLKRKGTSVDYDGDTEPVSALYESMPVWFMEETPEGKMLADKEAISLLLIAHGIPVNERTIAGSPLILAAEDKRFSVVAALLDKGADINAMDRDGATPLLHATDFSRLDGGLPHDTQAAAILISRGANVNRQDNDGKTALMNACNYGLTSVVRLLLAKGARIDLKDSDGKTALKIAKENNGVSIDGNSSPIDNNAILRMLKQAGAR